MPTVYQLLPEKQTFFINGVVAVGGKLNFYTAGTSTPKATYTDSTGTVTNANPIVLNSRGEPPDGVYGTTGNYKIVFTDAADVTIWTRDNVQQQNDLTAAIPITASEWLTTGFTPTYISTTSFSVTGDKTLTFSVNRRIRATISGAVLVYASVTGSSFGAGITTVTLSMDSTNLDSGLSVVDVSIMDPAAQSTPVKLSRPMTIVSPKLLATSTVRNTADNADRFVTLDDGRTYGTALHNNAGAVTGTTNQYIASGTYTPTLTHVSNISASTAAIAQWIRIGNVVTVSGKVNITFTLGTVTLGISLPIASNFATETQCAGASGLTNSLFTTTSIGVHADAANDRASLTFNTASSTTADFAYTFTYLVV